MKIRLKKSVLVRMDLSKKEAKVVMDLLGTMCIPRIKDLGFTESQSKEMDAVIFTVYDKLSNTIGGKEVEWDS